MTTVLDAQRLNEAETEARQLLLTEGFFTEDGKMRREAWAKRVKMDGQVVGLKGRIDVRIGYPGSMVSDLMLPGNKKVQVSNSVLMQANLELLP